MDEVKASYPVAHQDEPLGIPSAPRAASILR
ncbi:hypothetical protein ABIB45_003440 [Arthrobacter sp. UYCo732]